MSSGAIGPRARLAAAGFLAASAALVALLALAGWARAEVAPDDPRLIDKMEQLCLASALGNGGIDQAAAQFCDCAAPILARHLTPEARISFVEQNRAPDGPVYADEAAVYQEAAGACAPAP